MYTLARELRDLGYNVLNTAVSTRLKQMDFGLRQNRKCTECSDPGPGRDPLFRHIALESVRFIGNGLPAISVNAR